MIMKACHNSGERKVKLPLGSSPSKHMQTKATLTSIRLHNNLYYRYPLFTHIYIYLSMHLSGTTFSCHLKYLPFHSMPLSQSASRDSFDLEQIRSSPLPNLHVNVFGFDYEQSKSNSFSAAEMCFLQSYIFMEMIFKASALCLRKLKLG